MLRLPIELEIGLRYTRSKVADLGSVMAFILYFWNLHRRYRLRRCRTDCGAFCDEWLPERST